MDVVMLGTRTITIFTPMESSSSCASIFFIFFSPIKISQRVTVTKLIDKLILESQIGRQDGINEEDDIPQRLVVTQDPKKEIYVE